MRHGFLLLVCALLLAACQAAAPQAEIFTPLAAAATSIPVVKPTLTPADPIAAAPASPSPSAVPPGAPSATVTQTAAPLNEACQTGESVCILDGHFLLQRPIPLSANASVDDTYRYGLNQSGKREPHHGVEFPNSQGTPVLAAAPGVVVFAGDDKAVSLAWVPAFYGNVVVIVHELPGVSQTVFSLYAHLFKIEVSLGQQVSSGQVIGKVGATGKAIGSHLHFEVRLGQNDYRSNRNPDLWLAPLAGTGTLAGRIQDAQGRLLAGMLNVQRIENGILNSLPVTALETYITRESQPVRNDDVWQENFAAGELRAGVYRLTLHLNGKLYDKVVKIEPGRLTFVIFEVK